MRMSVPLTVLMAAVAACSPTETAVPTDVSMPHVDGGCPNSVKITPLSPTVSIVKNTSKLTAFSVKNNCTTSSTWVFSATKTGAVASLGAPSPTAATIAGGSSRKVSVNVTAGGSAGTGTVTLRADADGPAATFTGTETINVTN